MTRGELLHKKTVSIDIFNILFFEILIFYTKMYSLLSVTMQFTVVKDQFKTLL